MFLGTANIAQGFPGHHPSMLLEKGALRVAVCPLNL
jgi:hypothetical protein